MDMRALNLEHYWMPFTDNRRFKAKPKLVTAAKDMHFTTAEGRQVLDGLATLWCVNAGHARPRIVEAIRRQAGELDFAASFSLGHPLAFRLAERIAALAPAGMGHVFFTNSGSEAIDTAMKIAIGYHRLRGEGTRTRFVGRERSYHGVNLAGISLGGVPANRKAYSGALLPGVDHLRPHPSRFPKIYFSRGEPGRGAELAEELERIVTLHDASNIAALVVDPVSASGGVLVPPKGYLKRLREICTRHGILLVFDEVITGWGRLGTAFAAQHFGIEPDLITFAKGVTSGAVPLGGVIVKDSIYQAFTSGPDAGIEFFHGYTYSGHPLACAAGIATLKVYEEEKLFEKPRNSREILRGRHPFPQRPAARSRLPQPRADRRGRARAAPRRALRRASPRGVREVLGQGRVRAPGGRFAGVLPAAYRREEAPRPDVRGRK